MHNYVKILISIFIVLAMLPLMLSSCEEKQQYKPKMIESSNNGWRMMRNGTITGISAQSNASQTWTFEIRKNDAVAVRMRGFNHLSPPCNTLIT